MQRQNHTKSNLLWPLANGTAVNEGMSLAVSCCQTLKSVCYVSNNIYSASFDGVKDAAYTAIGSATEDEGVKGKGKVRGIQMGGKKGEGRDENKGRGWGSLCSKGVERGGEEQKGRRNGELTLTPEP